MDLFEKFEKLDGEVINDITISKYKLRGLYLGDDISFDNEVDFEIHHNLLGDCLVPETREELLAKDAENNHLYY